MDWHAIETVPLGLPRKIIYVPSATPSVFEARPMNTGRFLDLSTGEYRDGAVCYQDIPEPPQFIPDRPGL